MATDALKTASKEQVKKATEVTDNVIDNKIAGKTTGISLQSVSNKPEDRTRWKPIEIPT